MKRVPFVFCLVLFCSAALAQMVPRSTIRVGLWTLWHDKEVAITPVAGASLRMCESCAPRPLAAIIVRVKDAELSWTDVDGHSHSSAELLLAGSYKVAAHGESLSVSYPLIISAQSGGLALVATLAVAPPIRRNRARLWRLWRAVLRWLRHTDMLHSMFATRPTASGCTGARRRRLMRRHWPPPARACGATAGVPRPTFIRTVGGARQRLRRSGQRGSLRIELRRPRKFRASIPIARALARASGRPRCRESS